MGLEGLSLLSLNPWNLIRPEVIQSDSILQTPVTYFLTKAKAMSCLNPDLFETRSMAVELVFFLAV